MSLKRLYPILDTATLERSGMAAEEAAAIMLGSGVRMLQFRHKGFWSRDVLITAARVAEMCTQAEAIFILNDRADYAALLRTGLHIGQDDLLPRDARRLIGPEAILGWSTHSPEQLEAAGEALLDYVAFGPVFPTASKERPDPVVGIGGLRRARSLTARPLVAIGGITQENAQACFDAGANLVSVIGELLAPPCSAQVLRERLARWQEPEPRIVLV